MYLFGARPCGPVRLWCLLAADRAAPAAHRHRSYWASSCSICGFRDGGITQVPHSRMQRFWPPCGVCLCYVVSRLVGVLLVLFPLPAFVQMKCTTCSVAFGCMNGLSVCLAGLCHDGLKGEAKHGYKPSFLLGRRGQVRVLMQVGQPTMFFPAVQSSLRRFWRLVNSFPARFRQQQGLPC